MIRVLHILALIALAGFVAQNVQAAEPLPGDACTVGEEDNFLRSGGKEIPTGHFIVCKSGAWRSILSWDAAAAITKIGNLTCTNGQILKFNGTTWACAADDAGSGGDNLGNHTATQALNMGGFNITNAGTITGNGSGLTNLNAANLATGTIPDARFPATLPAISGANLTNLNASNLASGTVPTARLGTGTANSTVFLRGDGSWQAVPSGADNLGNHTATQALNMGGFNITNAGTITGTTITGTTFSGSGASLTALNATNIASGTVPDARFPATLPAISGVNLTNLNATNLASGTVASARLGTGTANATTFLRGDGQWAATTLKGIDDTGSCTAGKDGLIRYRTSGTPHWEYCHGGTTSWLPFRLPQCQDNGAGECTLPANRALGDPQFTAANIAQGINILGVTGTFTGGTATSCNLPAISGLVARWTMDETSGNTAFDTTGKKNAVVSTTATWQPTGGRIGGALSIPGNDNLGITSLDPGLNQLNALTYCTWYRTSQAKGVLAGANTDRWRGVWLDASWPGSLSFTVTTSANWMGAGSNNVYPVNNTWTHACVTWNGTLNGSGVNFYRNGASVARGWEQNGSGSVTANVSDGMFFLGSQEQGNRFVGQLDDTVVYNRALTGTEISSLYTAYQACF